MNGSLWKVKQICAFSYECAATWLIPQAPAQTSAAWSSGSSPVSPFTTQPDYRDVPEGPAAIGSLSETLSSRSRTPVLPDSHQPWWLFQDEEKWWFKLLLSFSSESPLVAGDIYCAIGAWGTDLFDWPTCLELGERLHFNWSCWKISVLIIVLLYLATCLQTRSYVRPNVKLNIIKYANSRKQHHCYHFKIN